MVLRYVDGKITDFEAAAAISEGQVVELVGDRRVQPTAGASGKVVGVALTSGDAGRKIAVVHVALRSSSPFDQQQHNGCFHV